MIHHRRRGIAAALLASALTGYGCQGEASRNTENLETVQAKFKRGQEEAAKVIEKGASSRGNTASPRK